MAQSTQPLADRMEPVAGSGTPIVIAPGHELTVLTIDIAKGLDPVDADAVMTDGETGWLVPPSSAPALAEALEEAEFQQSPRAGVLLVGDRHAVETELAAGQAGVWTTSGRTGTNLEALSAADLKGWMTLQQFLAAYADALGDSAASRAARSMRTGSSR